MRTEQQTMLAGEVCNAGDPEIEADPAAAKAWMVRYTAALARPVAERHRLLAERLGAVGPGAVIRPPFHGDDGFDIRLGAGVFLNVNGVILDAVEVSIGDRTRIGPAVQILAADHPRDAARRAQGMECGRPLRIGRAVWIGAGSVVTCDIPAAATAFGNPARIRPSPR
jgi:maltose O-acetyltransferase